MSFATTPNSKKDPYQACEHIWLKNALLKASKLFFPDISIITNSWDDWLVWSKEPDLAESLHIWFQAVAHAYDSDTWPMTWGGFPYFTFSDSINQWIRQVVFIIEEMVMLNNYQIVNLGTGKSRNDAMKANPCSFSVDPGKHCIGRKCHLMSSSPASTNY